jgi:hypothetical protein
VTKHFWSIVGLAALLVAVESRPARAADPALAVSLEPRSVADRPSATLLLPYFEVDLANPNGFTTQFTVNNASALASLAHVVIWSDLGVPVLTFDVYLTGYDVQRIDMRDVLAGILPQTASAGQDPTDVISPKGAFSNDINFASCGGLPPPALSAADAAGLRAALTGGASSLFAGKCCGRNLGDNHARGYVTVDSVSACSPLTPADGALYFGPVANDENVLWGDYAYIDRSRSGTSAAAGPLVHILSDPGDPAFADPLSVLNGRYTFYGRFVDFTAIDHRVALPTSFGARYFNPGTANEVLVGGPSTTPFTRSTQLLVWRDIKVSQGAFDCGTEPDWFPLAATQVLAFDESEQPQVPATVVPIFPQPPLEENEQFPAATQRVEVGGPDLPVDFFSGWLYLNLNFSLASVSKLPDTAQGWVEVLHDPGGRYSVGSRAIQFDNAAPTAASTGPGGLHIGF